MTVCVRIYTSMGKENCKTVDSFSLSTEQYSSTPCHYVTFQSSTDMTEIERIVEAGQPCNMHIRYEDSEVEGVCTLNGCKLVNARIHCDKPDFKIITWTGD